MTPHDEKSLVSRSLIGASTLIALALSLTWLPSAHAQSADGKDLAFSQSKGNCLACHTMKGGDVPSNVGPELTNMKTKFPNRADLVAILNDEAVRNPQTVMPPFGKDMILTDKEIDAIVDFLYTL